MQQAVFQIVKAEYELVENIKIDPEYSLLVPILSGEEYTRLKESITDVGLYEPIVINQDKILLDGHHRLKVVNELGWMKIPVERKHFESRLDEEIYVIETNVVRRQLSDYQKTILAMKLEPKYAEKAKQRMLAGVPLPPSEGRVPKKERESATKAAKAVGLKPTTYHRAKIVLETGTEKDIKAFKEEKQKPYTIYKNIKIREEKKELDEKVKDIPPLEGVFDTIVVDPPWDTGEYDQAAFAAAAIYPVMSVEEIKKINLPYAENCVVWLWATNAFLHEAYHVLESWGLTPKSVLTWVKEGLYVGVWLRGKTEHCILAVKGKPLWELGSQSTALFAKNKGHSIKPDEFYSLVDSLCYGRKLDYFAREPREGWITYGTMEGNNELP